MPYVEKNVGIDRAAAIEMVRISGQQGVPVIQIDDQVVVGFNKARLEQILAGSPAGAAGSRPGVPPAGGTRRRTLGAQVADARDITLRIHGRAVDGAYVGGVRPDSPAEWAGVRRGDVIAAVNGDPVRTASDLERIMADTLPGSRLVITILRNGSARDLETMI